MENGNSSVGILSILGLILITLKLCGKMNNVSWLIVLLPFIIETVVFLAVVIYVVVKDLRFERDVKKARSELDKD
jgi:hypothetical protein